jgi:hypothetical protein
VTEKKDHKQIMQDFRLRKDRQFVAIAVALLLIVFLALLHNRPDLFGQLPKKTILVTNSLSSQRSSDSTPSTGMPLLQKYLGTTSTDHMRNVDQIA